MAKAVEPRPRRLSAVFAVYLLVVLALTYYVSPQVAPYVDPGATFWILTAFVLLGSAALLGVCAGGISRAGKLDLRIEQFEAARRRARSAVAQAPPPRALLADSGSADHEVEALLEGLSEIGEVALAVDPVGDPDPEPSGSAVEELIGAEEWEIQRLRRARDAVAATVAGPAVAAVLLVGVVAPMLPASDGLLLANLPLNAFLGLAGVGWLVGIAGYAAAGFRHLKRVARA